MHIALDLLGVGPGDFVMVQSFTFCATSNPIKYLGATPVFIDSEKGTWNLCPQALERALEDFKSKGLLPRVKAIAPVHLYGMPAKMVEIIEVANRYGIPIVEDAAESLGSTLNGQHTGTFGLMGIYSFNGNKIITTSSGGALVSDDETLIKRARKLATQARDDAPHYEHSTVGYNYRMSNVCAGVGRGQMEVIQTRIEQRRAINERYRALFAKFEALGYHVDFQDEHEGAVSNYWLTAILMEPSQNKGKTREDLRLYLSEQAIESRPLWKPMHLQPLYSDAPFYGTGVSEHLFETGLCLPSGSNLTEEEWGRIEQALTQFFS
jgi:dTDP-4-amino-4,6-dideoxygalactose transaminase